MIETIFVWILGPTFAVIVAIFGSLAGMLAVFFGGLRWIETGKWWWQ